ncbi:MAG: hypothetical protein II401_08310 [Bacteroidales bacterium]|nr:hypothetical protein [Bacteroidales bacterium]
MNKDKSIKVGRLKLTIAKQIKRKCADIYLTPNYLKHIERRHKIELEKVGLSAVDFVSAVVNGYNQIREGSGDSILLVIFNSDLNYTAGIDMCLSGEYWEVKTAEPRKTEDIIKRKLLWKK